MYPRCKVLLETDFLMSRFLATLQLMRVALAFTAVADTWTIMFLHGPGRPAPANPVVSLILAGATSFFLYSFGMVLNDLLDARRDRLFAPWRPIPSGRISPAAATVLSLLFLLLSLFSAAMLIVYQRHVLMPISLLLAMGVALLIVFYNAAAKYLGAIGLLTLGLIRALNCLIGKPNSHFLLLSMLLFTHITLAGAAAYYLESKRPRLKLKDVAAIPAGLLFLNGLMLAAMVYWHQINRLFLLDALGLGLSFTAYFLWAGVIFFNRKIPPRVRGQRVMQIGLFWLFIYDSVLLASNGQPLAALVILALGVISVATFAILRLLGRDSPHKPQYRVLRAAASR